MKNYLALEYMLLGAILQDHTLLEQVNENHFDDPVLKRVIAKLLDSDPEELRELLSSLGVDWLSKRAMLDIHTKVIGNSRQSRSLKAKKRARFMLSSDADTIKNELISLANSIDSPE